MYVWEKETARVSKFTQVAISLLFVSLCHLSLFIMCYSRCMVIRIYLWTHTDPYLAVVYFILPKMSLLQGVLKSRSVFYQRDSLVFKNSGNRPWCKHAESDGSNWPQFPTFLKLFPSRLFIEPKITCLSQGSSQSVQYIWHTPSSHPHEHVQ